MYLFFSHLTFNKIISLYAQLQQPTLFFMMAMMTDCKEYCRSIILYFIEHFFVYFCWTCVLFSNVSISIEPAANCRSVGQGLSRMLPLRLRGRSISQILSSGLSLRCALPTTYSTAATCTRRPTTVQYTCRAMRGRLSL